MKLRIPNKEIRNINYINILFSVFCSPLRSGQFPRLGSDPRLILTNIREKAKTIDFIVFIVGCFQNDVSSSESLSRMRSLIFVN